MGWLSSAVKGIGHGLKAVAKPLGHYLTESGKLAGFIPGVGPVIGGAMTAAGNLIEGDPLKDALVNGAKAGVTQFGVGKILSHVPGLSGAAKLLGSGGLRPTGTFGRGPIMDGNGIDGSGGLSGIPQGIWDDPFGANGGLGDYGSGGGWGNILNGAARILGGGGGQGSGGGLNLGNLALGGLAGYQAINAANASKRAGQLSDKALGLAEQQWTDAAPLRSAGTARLLNPVKPNLSGAFADPSNPFAAAPPAASLGAPLARLLGAPGSPLQTALARVGR